jgi:hypothetical protein
MPRLVQVTSYIARMAAGSQGFNEWRENINISTEDSSTGCDVRFVDDPSAWQNVETVNENGWSMVYLPHAAFQNFLHLLQTEQPLFLVLYGGASKRAVLQTGSEPAGEEELS